MQRQDLSQAVRQSWWRTSATTMKQTWAGFVGATLAGLASAAVAMHPELLLPAHRDVEGQDADKPEIAQTGHALSPTKGA